MDYDQIELLKGRLKEIEIEQQKIRHAIEAIRCEEGVISFAFYRLSRQEKELNGEIIKINRYLHPDIIA